MNNPKPIENDSPINFQELKNDNDDDDNEFSQEDEGKKNIPNETFSLGTLKNKIKKRMSKSFTEFELGKYKIDYKKEEDDEKLLDISNSKNDNNNIQINNKNQQINNKDEKNNNINDDEIKENNSIDNEIHQTNTIDNENHQTNKFDDELNKNNNKIDNEINKSGGEIDDEINKNNKKIDDEINKNNNKIDNQINKNNNTIDNNNNTKEDLNNNDENNINQEINKNINNITTKDITKQNDTFSNKDNEITTDNDDNFLIFESELSKDLISDLKIGLSKSIATSNPEFILLIDASEEMENYIDPLINNLCYNSLKKLGYNEKEKVHLFCFNSEDIDERHIQFYKLSTIKIIAEGKREIGELFDTFLNTILNKKGKNFRVLFFFSGSVIWNFELFNSLKLFTINKDYNEIECYVVKYFINDKTTFNEQDDILFKFLRSFSCKSSKICDLNAENIDDNINKIYELFQN